MLLIHASKMRCKEGGVNGNERWNIFEPNLNSESLVNYVRGAEKSEKIGNLTSLDLIGSSQFNSNFSLYLERKWLMKH